MSRNEAQTRRELVDPKIAQHGWIGSLVKEEVNLGEIYLDGSKMPHRRNPKADYLLRIRIDNDCLPLAVALIEAKPENSSPISGLDQAKIYAKSKRFNIKFVYSTNGHQFVEYNIFTKQTSQPRSIDNFPTPDELRAKYEEGMKFKLDDPAAKALFINNPQFEGKRRYYQDAAIRAVLERIASGEKRALLSVATGAGKTFIAVGLLKKLTDAGLMRKALFVCDRDELRTQAKAAFREYFASDVDTAIKGNPQHNAKVIVATYQTLCKEMDGEDIFLVKNYPENYFSHIIIDECHRSGWGEWSEVFKRYYDAIQIGLTATPRIITLPEDEDEVIEDIKVTAHNYEYFGEPIYEYPYIQAVKDGYLSICEIVPNQINIDQTGLKKEEIADLNPTDFITGEPITFLEDMKKEYRYPDFEMKISLPDRTKAMCSHLFNSWLRRGDFHSAVHQKTIIFCVRDFHCDMVARELNNLYTEYCQKNNIKPCQNYSFKCTAESGKEAIPLFKDSRSNFFVATTCDLLTTGVDIPPVANIVFFRYLKSPIYFNQMVGRGTRLHEATNKMKFTIYDYTNATRLFDEETVGKIRKKSDTPSLPKNQKIIECKGVYVVISEQEKSYVIEANGKPKRITDTEYRKLIADDILLKIPSIKDFINIWINPESRKEMLEDLDRMGVPVDAINIIDQQNDYDLFDILANTVYKRKALSRAERVGLFMKSNALWLNQLPQNTKDVIWAIINQFITQGTECLENNQLFQVEDIKKAGGLEALMKAKISINDIKVRLFAA